MPLSIFLVAACTSSFCAETPRLEYNDMAQNYDSDRSSKN